MRQVALIDAVAGDEWWRDVSVPILETTRKRLRGLIHLIDRVQRRPVYTDFEDEIGKGAVIALPEFESSADRGRFLAKTRQFLVAHEDHITLHKVRRNLPLTASDLAELERMLLAAQVGTVDDLATATADSGGLGLFIRSLVGLDRQAAKDAFGQFLTGGSANANQVDFINLIIDHLTEYGVMSPTRLYESPFTDRSASGPEGVFSPAQVDSIVAVLDEIRRRAVA